jgi:hypothetical protein
MALIVFYAWQMDRDVKVNRWFIEKAIRSALKTLRLELRETEHDLKLANALPIETEEAQATYPGPEADADIVLTWGAQGEPGATLIAETILRRIEECDLFIADLTFVAHAETADNRRKLLPNSNVLIEVGAASRTGRRWDRMVLIVNNAFGTVESLPFDLRHRHCTVQYELQSSDDPEKSAKLKLLTQSIADQMRPILRRAASERRQARQREQEELRVSAVAAQAAVETKRLAFEKALGSGSFQGIQGTRGIAALTIAPVKPPPKPIDFSAIDQDSLQNGLRPLGADRHVTLTHAPTSVFAVFSAILRDDPQARREAVRVTRLDDDGVLYAAANLKYLEDRMADDAGNPFSAGQKWRWIFGHEQVALNRKVGEYLSALKQFGVSGPWVIGLSLLKMQNCLLTPHREPWETHGRHFEGTEMCARPVVVPADADLSTPESVQGFLAIAWHQIWRHCGYQRAPRFDPNGEFTGWE